MHTLARGAVATVVAVALVTVGIGIARWGMGAVEVTARDARSVAAASTAVPSGDGWAAWGARADGTPLRWDPCRPIDWVVRPDDPAWLVDVASTALRRVGRDAGVTFRHRGRAATEVGPRRSTMDGAAWAPVVVTLVDPDEVDWLDGDERALAVPVLVGDVFVTGQVLLDADTDLDDGFTDRRGSWGATLLHEAAHLVGLDHVEDPDQLLYPFPLPGPATLGDGDRRGLAALRADGGCLDAGPVRDLVVDDPRP